MQWHLYFTFSLSLCQWVLSKIECESYLGSNEHYLVKLWPKKKFRNLNPCTGLESMTSGILVQCSIK